MKKINVSSPYRFFLFLFCMCSAVVNAKNVAAPDKEVSEGCKPEEKQLITSALQKYAGGGQPGASSMAKPNCSQLNQAVSKYGNQAKEIARSCGVQLSAACLSEIQQEAQTKLGCELHLTQLATESHQAKASATPDQFPVDSASGDHLKSSKVASEDAVGADKQLECIEQKVAGAMGKQGGGDVANAGAGSAEGNGPEETSGNMPESRQTETAAVTESH